MGYSLKMGTKQQKTGAKVNKRPYPSLAAAKGYASGLPDMEHLQSFLAQKPLALAIPHPVSTPRLPPQEKISELRRFLWHVSSQQLPPARVFATWRVEMYRVFRIYGINSIWKGSQFVKKESVPEGDYDLREQINQWYIRVITHAFKTWRYALKYHDEAVAELKKQEAEKNESVQRKL